VTAAWAGSIAAMIMSVGAIGGLLWRAGRRDGKVDAAIEQLTSIAKDHEERLRAWRI
jgi:hypothetical protein